MSLEGTIRDLGLQEVGQLLSLSRKSGVLSVRSALRGARAWIRFADGAIVDAGEGDALVTGASTAPAAAGDRPAVEEAVLEVLAWREGTFAFAPAAVPGAGASRVRIPTDAMLVESARREDAWSRIRDRVPSASAVPSFVDVEPKSLPLLHLVPQEWEVLTRVDGERDLRTLAALLQRDVVEVGEIVHGLVGTGLLTVRDGQAPLRATLPHGSTPVGVGSLDELDGTPRQPPMSESVFDPDGDDLWIPAPAELAEFGALGADEVFDPQRAGLVSPHGTPLSAAGRTEAPAGEEQTAATVTVPAPTRVASGPSEPSSHDGRIEPVPDPAPDAIALREAGDVAARRGDFETALTCWSRYLRAHERAADADRVREALGLAARLQALLHPEPRA
jgi:hypothetical protein